MKSEKVVKVYCSRDVFTIHNLANQLENAHIDCEIIGDLATTVLGIDNPTQEICILINQRDVIRAKHLIEDILNND